MNNIQHLQKIINAEVPVLEINNYPNNLYVWRIQNKEGFGPYRTCEDLWNFKTHRPRPLPWYDGFALEPMVLGFRGSAFFGFTSKKDLNSWFPSKDRETLKALGYNVVRVKAKKIWKGYRQVIFIKG